MYIYETKMWYKWKDQNKSVNACFSPPLQEELNKHIRFCSVPFLKKTYLFPQSVHIENKNMAQV